jgi:hypothetical protein
MNETQQISDKNLYSNIRKLIDLWLNTMPNSYSDPPHTWDDVITNRCIYFEFIEDKYLNKLKMEIDDDDDSVQLRRSRESLFESVKETKTLMQLQFADAARLQSNYKLALNKLHRTRFIIKNEQKKYNHLKITWMHCYLRTHLSYTLKQFSSPNDRLINILQVSTLNKLIEYDVLAKDLLITNRGDLYRDQNIINSQFCKFILNAFLNIENLNEFLSGLKNNGELFDQIYKYVKHDDKIEINEDDFCNKPMLVGFFLVFI